MQTKSPLPKAVGFVFSYGRKLICLEHYTKGNDGSHDGGYNKAFFGLLRELKVEELFHNRNSLF